MAAPFLTYSVAAFHERFKLPFVVTIGAVFLVHVYYVSRFAYPALPPRKRLVFLTGMILGFVLFVAAATAGYTRILPPITARMEAPLGAEQWIIWGWNEYVGVAIWLCFGFGLLCELPVIAVVLGYCGLASAPWLVRTRPYGYIILLILTAISAPTPDPVTFIGLTIPVALLYEGCIWGVWLINRRRNRHTANLLA